MVERNVGAALVVGGGIAGMQASLDLAEAGIKVYLVDKTPSIGGVMAQLDKTFPTNDCAMCSLAPRMVDAGRHVNMEKLTYSEVVGLEGEAGHFRVQVRKKARSVDPDRCTGCGDCTGSCVGRYRAEPQEPVPPPPLPADEESRLAAILRRHAAAPSPLVRVLQDVNQEFNYLPPHILRHVAHALAVPLAYVVRVASFYPLFSLTPKGRHVITVCRGTTCTVRGADRLIEQLHDAIGIGPGEVTKDGRFSLETGRCFGLCALAPTMRVNQNLHAKVRTSHLGEILARY